MAFNPAPTFTTPPGEIDPPTPVVAVIFQVLIAKTILIV